MTRCVAVIELQYHDGAGVQRYECVREAGHADTDGKDAIHWADTGPMWRVPGMTPVTAQPTYGGPSPLAIATAPRAPWTHRVEGGPR